MADLIGFVDYGYEDVVIPLSRIAACHAAIAAWADTSYSSLEEGLRAHYHQFKRCGENSLCLTWINLEVQWLPLEAFYKFLAPFVESGGAVYCHDEEQQHVCYRFERSRVFRIEGHVIYDGECAEL